MLRHCYTPHYGKTVSMSCLLTLLVFVPGCSKPDINKVGGYVLVHQLDPLQDEMNSTDPVQDVITSLQRRLQPFDVGASQFKQVGEDKIETTLPGIDEETLKQVRKFIQSEGRLEFRLLAQPGRDDEIISNAQERGEDQNKDEPWGRWVDFDPAKVHVSKSVSRKDPQEGHELLVIEPRVGVEGKNLRSMEAGVDNSSRPCIQVSLGERGAAMMRELTSKNLPNPKLGTSRRLGILFDGQLVSAPTIQSQISDRFQITGNFSQQEIDDLIAIMQSGRLPHRLRHVETIRVEPKGP